MNRPEPTPMNPKLKEGLGYIVISILFFVVGWFYFEWNIADIMQVVFFILSALLILASWTPLSELIQEWWYKRKSKEEEEQK